MSFSDEFRIIPRTAWLIALLAGGGLFCLLMFVAMPHGRETRLWPLAGQIAFSGGMPLILMAAILLIGYINADARRRGMRYVMWTLLAIFLPNSIGIILYFIFRDPLLARCGKCGASGRANFTFCPQCGAELSPACPACKRAVESGWQRCAFCGAGLKPGSPAHAPGQVKP